MKIVYINKIILILRFHSCIGVKLTYTSLVLPLVRMRWYNLIWWLIQLCNWSNNKLSVWDRCGSFRSIDTSLLQRQIHAMDEVAYMSKGQRRFTANLSHSITPYNVHKLKDGCLMNELIVDETNHLWYQKEEEDRDSCSVSLILHCILFV